MPLALANWTWPASALLTWAGAWLLWRGVGGLPGAALALAVCGVAAWAHRRLARRWITFLGLPLLLGAQALGWPAWVWLLAAGMGLAVYPPQRWGEAPLFLTPAQALDGLGQHLTLVPGSRGLDAGCGTGAGLRALRRAFPTVVWQGTEASRLLAAWTQWTCPWAQIRQGDLWADDWRPMALVYVFLRPESMAQVRDKARRELGPGACLLSLDFPLPDIRPSASWPCAGRHWLYLYRAEALN